MCPVVHIRFRYQPIFTSLKEEMKVFTREYVEELERTGKMQDTSREQATERLMHDGEYLRKVLKT